MRIVNYFCLALRDIWCKKFFNAFDIDKFFFPVCTSNSSKEMMTQCPCVRARSREYFVVAFSRSRRVQLSWTLCPRVIVSWHQLRFKKTLIFLWKIYLMGPVLNTNHRWRYKNVGGRAVFIVNKNGSILKAESHNFPNIFETFMIFKKKGSPGGNEKNFLGRVQKWRERVVWIDWKSWHNFHLTMLFNLLSQYKLHK